MPLKQFSIRNRINGSRIFSGRFEDLNSCIESAIEKNVALSYADLSYTNLAGANLDGAILDQANLSYAYLENINLSEASLRGVNFSHACLINACMCESDLSQAAFVESNLKGIDITDSVLQETTFKDYSALDINFSDTKTLKNCIYLDHKEEKHEFSKAPIIIKAFSQRLTFFDQIADINGKLIDPRSLKNGKAVNDLRSLKTITHRLQSQFLQNIPQEL